MLWEDCEAVVEGAWNMNENEVLGLSQIKHKIEACGVELRAWGGAKSNPDTEAIKRLQKQIDNMILEEVTEDSRVEYLAISKNWIIYSSSRKFFRLKDLEFHGSSMETRTQNFAMPKLHNREEGIIFRE